MTGECLKLDNPPLIVCLGSTRVRRLVTVHIRWTTQKLTSRHRVAHNMDSASPKTPAKRASWFGSVKSRLSPSKSTTGDENASPKGSSGKKSVGRRFADSIRLHISKGEKEQQDTIIERPRMTSPCKSSRISGGTSQIVRFEWRC
jgi:hypothetical protein